MASTIKVEGFRELEKMLAELGKQSARRVGRGALRTVGNAILKEAKARVPVNEGRLKKSLRLRVDNLRNERSVMSAMVYVSGSKFDYRPKKTFRKTVMRKKRDRFNKVDHGYGYAIGSRPDVYGRFIEYGAPGHGMPARPFLRPAWIKEGGAAALNTLSLEIRNGIKKEVVRLRGLGYGGKSPR